MLKLLENHTLIHHLQKNLLFNLIFHFAVPENIKFELKISTTARRVASGSAGFSSEPTVVPVVYYFSKQNKEDPGSTNGTFSGLKARSGAGLSTQRRVLHLTYFSQEKQQSADSR